MKYDTINNNNDNEVNEVVEEVEVVDADEEDEEGEEEEEEEEEAADAINSEGDWIKTIQPFCILTKTSVCVTMCAKCNDIHYILHTYYETKYRFTLHDSRRSSWTFYCSPSL